MPILTIGSPRTPLTRLALACIAVWPLLASAAARADDDGDHDLARDLYERGEILPLSQILRVVQQHAEGDIVDLDLRRLHDRWIYVFQIVTSDGARVILDVDAAKATIVPDAGQQP